LRPEESQTIASALREFGLSHEDAFKLVEEASKEAKSLKPLWGKPSAGGPKGSRLIKLGAALIAFPIPTVGIKKSLGAMLIATGLVQEKMKHIHVADVNATFQDVYSELKKLQRK